MNFRTFSDLNRCIVSNIHKVPRDIDLVVGIPRSGLLAANLLANHRHLALTDLEGFIGGRLLAAGSSRRWGKAALGLEDCRSILVLDDSVYSGRAMAEARKRLREHPMSQNIRYAAVYVASPIETELDLFFEVCHIPRMFEWNVMHHPNLVNACLDIDGLLCRDPLELENDDAANYARFLNECEPALLPSVPVGYLVTCRLEKYRAATEEWLARHKVNFRELIMMNLPSKAARLQAGNHARFKAEAYERTGASIFLESDAAQAREIAYIACKPVYCTSVGEFYWPPGKRFWPRFARYLPELGAAKLRRSYKGIKERAVTSFLHRRADSK